MTWHLVFLIYKIWLGFALGAISGYLLGKIYRIRMFPDNPDFIIGTRENPYLYRWWLIPKNRFFGIYVHKFLRSDDDRALHDHPFPSLGMIIKGAYYEHMPLNQKTYMQYVFASDLGILPALNPVNGGDLTIQDTRTIKVLRRRFQLVPRRASHIHRIELQQDYRFSDYEFCCDIKIEIPVWSVFIVGPKIREWGFWCPFGFRHWRDFVSLTPGGNEVGPGCN